MRQRLDIQIVLSVFLSVFPEKVLSFGSVFLSVLSVGSVFLSVLNFLNFLNFLSSNRWFTFRIWHMIKPIKGTSYFIKVISKNSFASGFGNVRRYRNNVRRYRKNVRRYIYVFIIKFYVCIIKRFFNVFIPKLALY